MLPSLAVICSLERRAPVCACRAHPTPAKNERRNSSAISLADELERPSPAASERLLPGEKALNGLCNGRRLDTCSSEPLRHYAVLPHGGAAALAVEPVRTVVAPERALMLAVGRA